MEYDIESDILSWEISSGPIKNTKEFGQFLIHVSPANKPILIEILGASEFLKTFDKIKIKQQVSEILAK